jgi:hypothetical protein
MLSTDDDVDDNVVSVDLGAITGELAIRQRVITDALSVKAAAVGPDVAVKASAIADRQRAIADALNVIAVCKADAIGVDVGPANVVAIESEVAKRQSAIAEALNVIVVSTDVPVNIDAIDSALSAPHEQAVVDAMYLNMLSTD